jgi:hypothetical protein
MKSTSISLRALVIRTVITHTVTYSLMGWLALSLFDYAAWFSQSGLGATMRPMTHPMVMAGPLVQPLRGALFGGVFYMLRDMFFTRECGWLRMWLVLLVLGIINVFGPAPGSIEGFVYTRLSIADHLRGLPEVIVQSLLLALGVFYWTTRGAKRWAWTMGIAFAITTRATNPRALAGIPAVHVAHDAVRR